MGVASHSAIGQLIGFKLDVPPVVWHFRNKITDTIHQMDTGYNPLVAVTIDNRPD